MLKLRRLVIHKHRIVKPGTTLVFHDGYNVLLGKNGTGKTTLLNLIAMCLSCSFAGLEEEEFSLEYELELSIGRLQVAVSHLRRQAGGRKQPAERTFESEITLQFVDTVDTQGKDRSFTVNLKNGRLTVGGSKEFIPQNTIDLFESYGFFTGIVFECMEKLENTRESGNLDIYSSVYIDFVLMQNEICSRFDESIEWLNDVLKNARVQVIKTAAKIAMPVTPYRIPLQLRLAICNRVTDESPKNLARPFIEFSHTGLDFLKDTVDALNYSSATLMMELQSVDRFFSLTNKNEYAFGCVKLGFTKRSGQYLQIDRLSFGEKRLVGFFYYLALNQSVLIADELANGLHHEMIERCLDAAGDRQKFLATQNPLLLDHVPLQSSEDVRRTFIRCQLVSEGESEQMVWSGLSEDEAGAFYKDYEVGIQHTNDILRLRGLW